MASLTHKRAVRINIDLSAIRHNLEVARSCSGGQKLFAVVKADAYGHGAVRVACALDQADGFAVVTLAEAIELREAKITKPILVMQGAQAKQECDAFHQFKLWPSIHCAEQIEWFDACTISEPLPAWLKMDSGMGRLGFRAAEAATVLASEGRLNWIGVMTHLASADHLQSAQTNHQLAVFSDVIKPLAAAKPALMRSIANSAGLLAWPITDTDWARPGIMLYGSCPIPTDASDQLPALLSSMQVCAPVISKKQFKSGDVIGYAASYRCPESMLVGFLAIGYGDGLPRVLDSSASVLFKGKRCPIIGRVSMDSVAIDLRGLDEVHVGDRAVLWGPDHPVELLAKAANTISYELLTSIKGSREYA